jgi:hypothetical protein
LRTDDADVKWTVGQLINPDEDAWPAVVDWVSSAVRPVEILSAEPSKGEATLFALQVTTRSPMGAIALRSGGLLVDHGWLRILGAGADQIGDGLREWNALDGRPALDPPLVDALVVAYDTLGGFFALNGGAWPGQTGQVHYLAPETYERQPLDLGYSGFVQFATSGDLGGFYGDLRWPGWEREVAALGPDQVISMYPFLGFENMPVQERHRRPIPAREAWTFFWTMSEQTRNVPTGASVQVEFTD